MSAWGTAIFSDDTACDVRDDWRDLVGDGLSGVEATDSLLSKWSDTLTDPDEAPVFWLALANTQWKSGRLEERVKAEAIAIMDNDIDLTRWVHSPNEWKKRKAVLLKLRDQIESKQPPEKRIRKRFRDSCDWQIGELIAYQLRSGLFTVFRITGHHSDKGGTSPVCELVDFTFSDIPSETHLAGVPVRAPSGCWTGKGHEFMIVRSSAKQLPVERVHRLEIIQKPIGSGGRCFVFSWSDLDNLLKDIFGIE